MASLSMATKKQLLIKQTLLIFFILIIGWLSIYNKWHDDFFIFWFFSILMSFFLVPVTTLYFLRKDNFIRLGKLFRFLIYFYIVGVFLVLLSGLTDLFFVVALIAEGMVTWHNILQTLYNSFYFNITNAGAVNVGAIIVDLVVIALSWWTIRVNKLFYKIN